MEGQEIQQTLSAIYGVLGEIYKGISSNPSKPQAKQKVDPMVKQIASLSGVKLDPGTMKSVVNTANAIADISKKDLNKATTFLKDFSKVLPGFIKSIGDGIPEGSLDGLSKLVTFLGFFAKTSELALLKVKMSLPGIGKAVSKFIKDVNAGLGANTGNLSYASLGGLNAVAALLKTLSEISGTSYIKLKVMLPLIKNTLINFITDVNSGVEQATKGNKATKSSLGGLMGAAKVLQALTKMSGWAYLKLRFWMPKMAKVIADFIIEVNGAVGSTKSNKSALSGLKAVAQLLNTLSKISILTAIKLQITLPLIGNALAKFISKIGSVTTKNDIGKTFKGTSKAIDLSIKLVNAVGKLLLVTVAAAFGIAMIGSKFEGPEILKGAMATGIVLMAVAGVAQMTKKAGEIDEKSVNAGRRLLLQSMGMFTVIEGLVAGLGLIGSKFEGPEILKGAMAAGIVLMAVAGVAFLTANVAKNKHGKEITPQAFRHGMAIMAMSTAVIATSVAMGYALGDIGKKHDKKSLLKGMAALSVVLGAVGVAAAGIIAIGALMGSGGAAPVALGVAVIAVSLLAIHAVIKFAEHIVDLVKSVATITPNDLSNLRNNIIGSDGMLATFGLIIAGIIDMNPWGTQKTTNDGGIIKKFFGKALQNVTLPAALFNVFFKSAMIMMALLPISMMISVVGKFSKLKYISGYSADGTPQYASYTPEMFKSAGSQISKGFSTFVSEVVHAFDGFPDDKDFNKKNIKKIKKLMEPVSRFISLISKYNEGKWFDEDGNEHIGFNEEMFVNAAVAITNGFGIFTSTIAPIFAEIDTDDIKKSKSRKLNKLFGPVGSFIDIISQFAEGQFTSGDGQAKDLNTTFQEAAKTITEGFTVFVSNLSEMQSIDNKGLKNAKKAVEQIADAFSPFQQGGKDNKGLIHIYNGVLKKDVITDIGAAEIGIDGIASCIAKFAGLDTTLHAIDTAALETWKKANEEFASVANKTIEVGNKQKTTLESIDNALTKNKRDRKNALEEMISLWRELGETMDKSNDSMSKLQETTKLMKDAVVTASGLEETSDGNVKKGSWFNNMLNNIGWGNRKDEAGTSPVPQQQSVQAQQQVAPSSAPQQQAASVTDLESAINNDEREIFIKLDRGNADILIKAMLQYI